MATSMGSLGYSSSSFAKATGLFRRARKSCRSSVCCAAYPTSLTDQYQTLRIQPGASEKDVKKAFRQLALQYHPDVYKGRDCGVKFQRINEAYDIVMNALRAGEEEPPQQEWRPEGTDDGYCDGSWDLWEEWMGWEGAGTMDYSSHINPYI